MTYSVQLISQEEKEELAERYGKQVLFEIKSDIYGCCIKLLTGQSSAKSRWEENFYGAAYNIRSHGRMYVIKDPELGENQVRYDPQSKTCFLVNMDYYGWIKSLALSLAGDILEDEHSIYSVHGACLDFSGKGLCILGGSGVGKTTHTYGLLRDPKVRVVSDDWFFVRIFGQDLLGYGSEKNFYIRADLADIWTEFSDLVKKASFDQKGRAVVDLRWVIGKGRILPLTTLENLIILTRNQEEKEMKRELEPSEALRALEDNGYFNPHLLVENDFKDNIRRRFFAALLSRTRIWQINTVGSPDESQRLIRECLKD
ncbi:MAG: aldolase [Methanotrichaceae archaeon]|nr:aldolase [Methanotrichaceae archaeon]